MSIYQHTDYKEYLKAQIREHRGRVGYKSQLARAAGCPASLISQVLHTHVHLSLDHAVGLARFWGLSVAERDYFFDMVNLARAASLELKQLLRQRIAEAKRRSEDMARRFSQPKIENTSQEWTYYSAWHFAAIHMLLTIPSFQSPEAMARRLQIPQALVESALQTLAEMGLAKKSGARWEPQQKSIHLSRQSPVSAVNHTLWRQRAINNIYHAGEAGLHYTALQTLSRADFEEIKTMLLDMIERMRKKIVPSPEESLVCFTCDWFEV